MHTSLGRFKPLQRFLLCSALTLPCLAQVGQNGIDAGLGTITRGPVDTNALTGGTAEIGIQYYPGDGRTYISRRGIGASTSPPHSIIALDSNGVLVGTTVQGPGAAGLAIGHRDGATDGYAGGTKLFWGDELGIHCYEMSSGVPVYLTGSQIIMAANGPRACTFPVPAQTFLGIVTALEYDPSGAQGNGSFWIANSGSVLIEVDRAGSLLRSIVGGSPGWSVSGLALNIQNGRMWANGGSMPTPASRPEILELDTISGLLTGRKFGLAAKPGSGPWIFSARGGLCYIQGRTGPTHGPASAPPFSELGVLTQGTPDHFTFHRLDMLLGFPSELESSITASLNGGPYSSVNSIWTPGSSLSIQYSTPPTNPGSSAIMIANVVPAGTSMPSGNTFNIPEYRSLHALSLPSAASSGITALTVGDGFSLAGLLAPSFIILPLKTQPPGLVSTFTLPSFGGPGSRLIFQGVYLSYGLTPIATNLLVLTEI